GRAAGIVRAGTQNPVNQASQSTTMVGGNGGSGGGTATTTTGGRGGDAGTAVAIEVANSVGTSQLLTNTANGVAGGAGGLGGNGGTTNGNGGSGGDADAVFLIAARNVDASGNSLQNIRGGIGANGAVAGGGCGIGGDVGPATGIAAVYTSPGLSSNWVTTTQGGRGGDSLIGTNGGRGGDAYGVISGLVLNGLSAGDTITSVTKGGAGNGPPIQTSYADGYYLTGNKTFEVRFTVDNATLSSIGSYEFFVDNYTE